MSKLTPQFPIKYSKAFIEKAGMNVLAREKSRSLLGTIWFYVIDSLFPAKKHHLPMWLREQYEEAKKDEKLKDIAKYYKMADDDSTMARLHMWVVNNIKYIPDMKKDGRLEYWQTASETLSRRSGDCEDFSILMLTLALLNDIDPAQLMIRCGWVYNRNMPNEQEGHAYLVYLPHHDGVWRILDGTYWPNPRPMAQLPFPGDDKRYKDVWFQFNTLRYYGKYRRRR